MIEVFKIVLNLSPPKFSDFLFDSNKITGGHQQGRAVRGGR